MRELLSYYLSPEARDRRVKELTSRIRAEHVSYGRSVQNRPLTAIRVPWTGSGEARKRVLLCANLHGLEYIGTAVVLRLLDLLDDPAPELQKLRDRAEIWVIPTANPDGYAATWEAAGKGPMKQFRCNANGVDLNRNFQPIEPLPKWAPSLGGWATGSDDPESTFFRGTEPFSEPETAGLRDLFDEVDFYASINLHSTAGTVFPPFTRSKEDRNTYIDLARAFSKAQPDWRYRYLKWPIDWCVGEQEDYQHYFKRTWAVCVECFPLRASFQQNLRAPRIFWRFNPKDWERWVKNDVPGLLAYYHAALDLERPNP